MGFLSNKVERNEIKPGDHIYTYRAILAYSHHGIFIGGNKVIHFTPEEIPSPSIPKSCPTFPNCGFKQPKSGVKLSCLNCFLKNGSLYLFEYGVSISVFISKLRGGTCTIAKTDPNRSVIHRSIYLLQNGYRNYDVFQNNCEDFALYCKTGLITVDRVWVGRSGQASSVIGAILSSPMKFLLPPASSFGVATLTVGMSCISRYAADIGVRSDVVKVPAEDLAVNLGWVGRPGSLL